MNRLLAMVFALVVAAPSPAITIDTVPVGDIGNPNDTATGDGRVDYAYRISKYEVTIGQYIAFLNAVAATDTYGLYNPAMATNFHIAGISQNGNDGHYSYTAIGSPNRPVTYVSWGDAARFSNWLQNGQPTGAQDLSTTEGGAYLLNGATSADALMLVSRKLGATWGIPTKNEWYKAAYYQPASLGGDSDNYWDYPMKTNSKPYSDQPPGATPDNTRVGNFYQNDLIANGYDDGFAVPGSPFPSDSQNMLTDVGAYTLSSSFYGTFDQGANVTEWTEEISKESSSMRVVSGGTYGDTYPGMEAAFENFTSHFNPRAEFNTIGIRLISFQASVPEPCCVALCIAGVLTLGTRRGGKNLG